MFYRRRAVCLLDLGDRLADLWSVCSGQSLGVRDGDEVVVVGRLPTQVEMRWEGAMVVMVGGAQAKYMVLSVSW